MLLPQHPRTRARIAEQPGSSAGAAHVRRLTGLSGECAIRTASGAGGDRIRAESRRRPSCRAHHADGPARHRMDGALDCSLNRLADPPDPAFRLTAKAQQLELEASQPRPPLYCNGHAAGALWLRRFWVDSRSCDPGNANDVFLLHS